VGRDLQTEEMGEKTMINANNKRNRIEKSLLKSRTKYFPYPYPIKLNQF